MAVSRIQGLHILRGFLGAAERQAAFAAAVRASGQAHCEALRSRRPLVSPAHNVNSRERYKSVTFTTDEGAETTCEHFEKYAEGHRLTYFRGVLPEFGVPDLVGRLAALPPVREEVTSSRQRHDRASEAPFKWRVTLNHYLPATGAGAGAQAGAGAAAGAAGNAEAAAVRKGFPWHRDLFANGASTMILNLGAPGGLEFGEEPEPAAAGPPEYGLRYSSDHTAAPGSQIAPLESVELTDGDLLILTGQARWEYLHRVLPRQGGDERASLVYGVW